MNQASNPSALAGQRIVVPGGTGGVGEGVVRQLLRAGGEVVVPTRSTERGVELQTALGEDATEHLHLIEHEYTSFASAQQFAEQVVHYRGGIDSVVAPIGGWWAGGPLSGIDESDWSAAFVELATAHAAVMRACLPFLTNRGAYVMIVGDSAERPVPGSGLVSMEQASVLMMQRVLAAEVAETRRVFAFLLGQVATRTTGAGQITADQVGQVAVAATSGSAGSQIVRVHDENEVSAALAELGASGALVR